jgi:hypothetical protein
LVNECLIVRDKEDVGSFALVVPEI